MTVKPCRVEGCLLPKALPAHRCAWHDTMARPIEVQVSAARAREVCVPEDARLPRVDATMWTPGTRWCASCQSMPPLFYFAPNASQCRACSSAARHDASIRREYDLTGEEYGALLELQGGRCAICRQRPVSVRLAVDHDHQTGKVRGLLCSRCNHDLLGAGHDSGHRLRIAAAYLDTPPMSGQWVAPSPHKPVRGSSASSSVSPADVVEFGSEAAARGLPAVLVAAAERMSVDDLIRSGGKSDPDHPGLYWLAYRKSQDKNPPW